MVHQIDFAQQGIVNPGQRVWLFRDDNIPWQPFDDGGGFWPLDTPQPVRRGDIRHLDVFGDDVFFQALLHGPGHSRLEVQEDFVLQNINVEVALDFAFGRDERGVTTRAGPQLLHIVCHLPIEKLYAICSKETEPSPETEVHDACRFAQRGVLGRRIAVMGDGFLAVQVQKPRAHGLMKVMQLQRTHVITSIISNMRNVFTKECKGKTHKFRRRDADGCDRDGRAPEKVAKDRGALNLTWTICHLRVGIM